MKSKCELEIQSKIEDIIEKWGKNWVEKWGQNWGQNWIKDMDEVKMELKQVKVNIRNWGQNWGQDRNTTLECIEARFEVKIELKNLKNSFFTFL